MTTDAADQFRDVSNRLSKGVAVVSARQRGLDVARTVTDVIAVSWDPPTVLVSLYSLGRMAEAIAETDSWALSFLSASQRGIAQWLSEPGTPLVGLLDSVPHHRRDPDGPALIDGALAWVEARTSESFEVATHTLTAGTVTWMESNPGAGSRVLLRQFGQYFQA